MPSSNPKTAQDSFQSFILGGVNQKRGMRKSSSSPSSSKQNESEKQQHLPPMMKNINYEQYTPVSLSHPTQSSSHFDEKKLTPNERRAAISLNPQNSASGFNNNSNTSNSKLMYSPSSASSQNNQETFAVGSPLPRTPVPSRGQQGKMMMHNSNNRTPQHHSSSRTPAPTSKLRQSFNQKVEEAKRRASPSGVDKNLGVEIDFVPSSQKKKTKNEIATIMSHHSDDDDDGTGGGATRSSNNHNNDHNKMMRSTSPIQDRNEAASEVQWCRFAYNKLENTDQDAINKLKQKQKERDDKRKARLAAREAKFNESMMNQSRISSASLNKMSARERLLYHHHQRVGSASTRRTLDDEEEEEFFEEEEEQEQNENDDDHQNKSASQSTRKSLSDVLGNNNNNNKNRNSATSNKKKRSNNPDSEQPEEPEEEPLDFSTLEPGMVRKNLAPSLANFAQQIQLTGKDKFINAYFNEFKDWNIEEMLAAAEEKHGENFLQDALGAMAGNNTITSGDAASQQQGKLLMNNNTTSGNSVSASNLRQKGASPSSGSGGGGAFSLASKNLSKNTRALLEKKRKEQQDQRSKQDTTDMKEALRTSFEQAFSPMKIDLGEVFQGQDLSSNSLGSLRTFDQRVMFLKKKLLIQEAQKRKASIRYIRDITESLRQDEGLFKSFSEDVRKEQMQRLRIHRVAQELLNSQRKLFQERTTQQRAEDFLKVEVIRREKAEASRMEQEETFFAFCENALAMRRGASYSRQYAWMPIIIFVLSLIRFDKKLKMARATLAEKRVMESAKRDFSNVFVPTRVTGFLRLAQGYKEAAKKKAMESAVSGTKQQLTKQEVAVQHEIRKKRDHYLELKKPELVHSEHPPYAFERLFAKLRELQFPIFLNRAIRRQRHRSANRLTVFLRTLFQQTVIRIRCKTYLKYMHACANAFLLAVRNRRTRRNFVWTLQFKQAVQERRFYDLPMCVEADHVLKRRERIRQKCAYEQKKALESVALMREKMLSRKVEAIVGSAVPESEKKKRRRKKRNNNINGGGGGISDDDDDDYNNDDYDSNDDDDEDELSITQSPGGNNKSILSPHDSSFSRPGTAATFQSNNSNNNNNNNKNKQQQNGLKSPSASPIRNLHHQSPGTPPIPFYRGESPTKSGGQQNNNNNGSAFNALMLDSNQNNSQRQDIITLAQSNPQAAVAAATNDHEICRLLCAPVMIPHPYGKFGPHPREASVVARATMEYFRCSEIKWSPSETSMISILEYVQKVEDRCVYDQYVDWLQTNRKYRERADFLESVLSHLRDDAPTKPDLEKQYQTLLSGKPKPPRQPYVLPNSEMRIIVFAAYTLTAHEKRVSAKASKEEQHGSGGNKKDNNNNKEGAGEFIPASQEWKIGADGKPNPIYFESNLKSHLCRAMNLFKELHGNVRSFLLEEVMKE